MHNIEPKELVPKENIPCESIYKQRIHAKPICPVRSKKLIFLVSSNQKTAHKGFLLDGLSK